MLMAAAGAATHMGGSAHSSVSPPLAPPWHPVVLVPSHHYQHQVLYDLGTPSPSPTTPATASPPGNNRLRPESRRRACKPRPRPRRPRPSRKLPTTYISADAASFRRMVHQVTGADDDVPGHAAPPALPSRAGLSLTSTTQAETLLLPPTLDTSAFLMLGAAAGGGTGTGTWRGAAPARTHGASCCHGSAAAAAAVDPGAAALQVKAEEEARGGDEGGFPSVVSWEEEDDDALF